jgi:hypothetical protein
MCGGYAARKSLMSTGSWLAYGGILRNLAIGVVRFLHNARRRHVVTIASTDLGAMIEIMNSGVTIETMDHGLTRIETTGQGLIQGLTTTMTNKNIFDFSQGTLVRSCSSSSL